MTINYLDSKRLQGLSSDIVNTPTFSDDYTTNSGWTQTGTTVTVDSGTADKLDFTAVVGNADHRVSKAIGVTLSDTLWICDYEINITAMGALTEAFPLFISAGTAKLRSTQDELGTTIYNNAGTHQMAITSRLDNSGLNSTYINISLSTLYYIRLERTSATNVRLNIFSDSGRTSHIAGSPVNYTINSGIGGLTTVQHSSDDGAGNANTINLTIDNLKIYDGVSSLTNKPTNVQTNSIFEHTNTGVRYWYNGTVWKPEYYFAIIASHFYVTTNTEKLDYNTTTTSNSTSLSTAKSGTCAFGTEHIGYFAGGAVTGGYSTSSERFAYSDSVVSSSATLSVYHGWGGAWSRPTIGYVVKGNSGGAYGTTVEKFSHSTNTYSTGTSMTQSSSNGTHQSITIGYSTGRWANGSFGDTQKYTFSSDGVTSGTSLLTTTSAHCASSTQANGIIMGGQTGNGSGFQTRIEKYNHSTDAITLHGSSLTTSGNLNQGYGNTKNAYAIQISQDNNITISNKLNHPTGTITSFNVLLSGNGGSSTTTENEVII